MQRQTRASTKRNILRKTGSALGFAAQPRFSDVIENSLNTSVDPGACVPLTNIRKISRSGVDRLKKIFVKSGFTSGSDLAIVVPLTGAHRHHLASHFKDKGLSSDEASQKIESRTDWYGIVDGVHRHSAILELMQSDDEDLKKFWDSFCWPVTLLRGGFSLQTLKQLARAQNEKHSEEFYVEPTLYDVLYGLKEEHDRLKSEKSVKKVTIAEIAAAYDGASHTKESTRKQTAATAARLSSTVIGAIGDIMNEEHIDLAAALLGGQERIDFNITRQSITSKIDCRVFRKFINLTSLKQSTTFMTAEGENSEEIQIHTLYRLRELCKDKKFKPVQHTAVTEQFKKASRALTEVQKFELFLSGENWPTDMHAARENLLRTTRLDEELKENFGNDTEILPFLRDLYFKLYPSSGPIKEAKYKAQYNPVPIPQQGNDINATISHTSDADARSQQRNSEVPEQDDGDTNGAVVHQENELGRSQEVLSENQCLDHDMNLSADSTEGENSAIAKNPDLKSNSLVTKNGRSDGNNFTTQRKETRSSPEEQQKTETSERLETNISSAKTEIEKDNYVTQSPYKILQEKKIECHQMTWQEYERRVRRHDDSLYDMVLSDPPYGLEPNASGTGKNYSDLLDDKEVTGFCQFVHRVLKPGGYLFVFSSIRYLQKWIGSLRDSGFRSMSHVYSLSKSPDRIQYHRLSPFPQNLSEFGVVARKNGTHPRQFEPDFTSPYHRIQCPLPRRFSTITNIPVPANKLRFPGKKSTVRVEEKNVYLLIELMTTFCPDGGSVLDAYAGTMTTALACIETDRSCLVIEKDPECFRLAHERLRKKVMSQKRKVDRSKSLEGEKSQKRLNKAVKPREDIAAGKADSVQNGVTRQKANENVRSSDLNSFNHLLPGQDVELTVDGKVVGMAKLSFPTPGELYPIRRTLHLHNLADLSDPGVYLVVIWKVAIMNSMKEMQYPYTTPGAEISETIWEICKTVSMRGMQTK